MLASIKLNQFPEYRHCSWVKSLISISSDFFKSEVMNGTLFLECSYSLEERLTLLNEASGMDFSYSIYKTGTIEDVKALMESV